VSTLESGETPLLHTPCDFANQLTHVPWITFPFGLDHSLSELGELKNRQAPRLRRLGTGRS